MKMMISMAAALLFALTAGALAQGGCGYGPPPQSAEQFLHSIYDRYIGPEDKTHPIDYSKDAELRKYFDPSLVAMIIKDGEAAARRNEVPMLDGDPFVGSQEWNIPAFTFQVAPTDATHAAATVKFVNYGKPQTFKVTLVHTGGVWKIWDIDWGGDAGTLRGLYKDQH